MTCTIFSIYLKKWGLPSQWGEIRCLSEGMNNEQPLKMLPRRTKTQCPIVNWLIVLWMKTDMHKMGNDRRTHPPLINIYMWIMRLNFASPVCAGAFATRVAVQRAGHYFIWNPMSAEFIRGSRFPVDARILFALNGFSLMHLRWETCHRCCVFVEAPGTQSERWFLVLGD